MAIRISVAIDPHKLKEVQDELGHIKKGVPRALAGAINDTARSQVTAISRKIRETVNIKKKDIDKHLKRTRANVQRLSAHITLSESPRLELKYFGAKKTKKGITYKIDKKGKRSTVDYAFINTGAQAHGHVFFRALESDPARLAKLSVKKYKGKKLEPPYRRRRLKIFKVFGISPWGAFVRSGADTAVYRDTTTLLNKNIDRKIKWLLDKNPRATSDTP